MHVFLSSDDLGPPFAVRCRAGMQTQCKKRGTRGDAAEMVRGFNDLIRATVGGGGQFSERGGREHYREPCTEEEHTLSAD